MGRRVADFRPGENGQLALDAVRGLVRRRDDVQRTDALAVKSGVLREALCGSCPRREMSAFADRAALRYGGERRTVTYLADKQGDAPPDKLAHRPGVVVEVAARKALIRAIEEREVALLEHHVCNLRPLFPGWVDAGRVVSTCMEKEDRARRGALEGLEEGPECEADRLWVVVRVCGDWDAGQGENLVVIDCFIATSANNPTSRPQWRVAPGA